MDVFKDYIDKVKAMFDELDSKKKMAIGGGAGALMAKRSLPSGP